MAIPPQSDIAWRHTFDKYFKKCYERERKAGNPTAEAIGQAFQETVDLEYHPDFPVQLPVNQRVLGEWGEAFQKRMNEEIHIAIIDCDTDTPVVAIIKVKREWLHCQLPQWLIDNEEYDYFYEIPDEEDKLIEHFLFVYCGYSQNRLHWHIVPADTKFKRLTVKDFQK